jgi:hypothetical protein
LIAAGVKYAFVGFAKNAVFLRVGEGKTYELRPGVEPLGIKRNAPLKTGTDKSKAAGETWVKRRSRNPITRNRYRSLSIVPQLFFAARLIVSFIAKSSWPN